MLGAGIAHRKLLVVALMAFALLGFACSADGDESTSRLRVVTSLELFADFVRQVGGERVEVTALLPSGADPHTYEPAPRRVADVVRADLIFVNGLGLEGGLRKIIDENAQGPVVELAHGIFPADGNPHLWLDPQFISRYVRNILGALEAVDPAGRDDYRAAAKAYLSTIAVLDQEFESAVMSIPSANRKLVTFHDAFPAMADRYGIEVVAVVAPSPGQEPNARDVAELVDALESEGVRAVFREPQFNASVLELAASDAGVRVLDLLSDAYVGEVDSYVELMRFNMRQLQEGLGGS